MTFTHFVGAFDNNGLAYIQFNDGHYGYINTQGQEVDMLTVNK